MIAFIPSCTAPVTDLASKEETRWAVQGVRLRTLQSKTAGDSPEFEMSATDCKRLIRVRGPPVQAESIGIPAIDTAPNSATEAIIPAKAFREQMKNADKISKKLEREHRQRLAVVMGEKTTTTAVIQRMPTGENDSGESQVANHGNIEGRFPPIEEVFPKRRPVLTVHVGAKLMAETLKAVAAVSSKIDVVTLELHAEKSAPIVVKGYDIQPELTAVEALVCPVHGSDYNPAEISEVANLKDENDQLRQRIKELEEQYDRR